MRKNLIGLAWTLCAATAPFTATATVVGQVAGPLTVSSNASNIATSTLATPLTGDVYIELTISLDAGNLDSSDFFALWLDTGTGGSHTASPNLGLKVNGGTGGADWMVRTTGTAGSYAQSLQATVGTTTTLYAHLSKSTIGGTYDTFELWADPVGSWSTVLANTPDAVSTLDSGLVSLTSFGFRAANLDAGDSVTVQALSISDAIPPSAVPEPSAAVLALLGVTAIAGTLTRKRTGSPAQT